MGTIAAGGTRSEREGMIACLLTDARALSLRAATREILRLYKENDILTYASAISFQVVFALVPLALLALALFSTFGGMGVWTHDIVRRVLSHQHLLWVTLGSAIAVWEVSGAMRATMQVLNRVYGVEETRSFRRKLGESIVLSTAVTFMLLLASAVVQAGPRAAEDLLGGGPGGFLP